MKLSVVIPTYNRLPVLRRVLTSLEKQETNEFEVIVVDDGSSDGTEDFLSSFAPPFPFQRHRQENAGPARARNRGVEMAEGEIVGFFGDDTILSEHCLARHREAHEKEGGTAVLGYTGWHPELKVTPFMDYINRFGLQFGYDIIPDKENVPFNFFYTSNVTLPAEAIRSAGGFDESFPFAAWEDIECAYRMMKGGLRMVYRPEAVCYHHHPTTMASFSARQYKSGIAAAVMFDKHPELATFLGVHLAVETTENRPVHLKIEERVCRALETQSWFRPRGWFRAIMENHYLRGLSAELMRRKVMP